MNILLVGLGPHARYYHYKILEKHMDKYNVKIKLLIDLVDQQDQIGSYIAGKSLKPERMIFLEESNRNMDKLPESLTGELDRLARAEKIDGMIISTEPKSHKKYILWAVRNNIDVLVDKPITAYEMDIENPENACGIYRDYLEIKEALKRSTSKISVMVARRRQSGINFIRDYLARELEQYRVPITYMSIYHAEGMWNMPDEFEYRENHPYKYGYGLMLHSGYHFVDLLNWMAELNKIVIGGFPDSIEIFASNTTPYDFLHQVRQDAYDKFFTHHCFGKCFEDANINAYKKYGEVDVNAILQFKQDDAVITTGVLNLLQTSFSRRAWAELPADTYKKNGRVRHEAFCFQVATLISIHAHLFQTGEFGADQKFTVKIFRNSGLIGGKTYEEVTFSDTGGNQSMLGEAREKILTAWLAKSDTQTEFWLHANTELLLSKIYESLLKGRKNLCREVKMYPEKIHRI
ncbi:MAG TPA: Gfo/Idh/MocA family oxidoreductase [Clostridia bacterium]|nr:Gfo/Idh/MocA family oxidoreductase [Clostridia bacterium]